MTRMDDKIQVEGVSATDYRRSDGALDSYRDPAETWSSQGTVYVWIQEHRNTSRPVAVGPAGRQEIEPKIGFLESTSGVLELDVLQVGSARYQVNHVETVKGFGGEVSHLEADLMLMEEG